MYFITDSGALLKKLTIAHLGNKFSIFCETLKFITIFTRARHWTLPWIRLIQSKSSTPCFLKIHLNIYLPIWTWGSQIVLSLQVYQLNHACIAQPSHACYKLGPSHPLWLDHPNKIETWWAFRAVSPCSVAPDEEHIPWSSSSSFCFLSRRSTNSYHPVLKLLQSMFFPLRLETKCHTHTKQ
jgi:hypothetical protein